MLGRPCSFRDGRPCAGEGVAGRLHIRAWHRPLAALDMALIDVRPPSCAASAGVHAADIPVCRLIFRLRDRAAESEVLALDRPMCVLCHFRLSLARVTGPRSLLPYHIRLWWECQRESTDFCIYFWPSEVVANATDAQQIAAANGSGRRQLRIRASLAAALAELVVRTTIHTRPHEDLRDFRHDCIAVAPQESHTAGYPISQRECPGLNTPRHHHAPTACHLPLATRHQAPP